MPRATLITALCLFFVAGCPPPQLPVDGNEPQPPSPDQNVTAVLGPTLAALSPAEWHTMGYAALLLPDHVPLPWLEALITKDLPELASATRLALEPDGPGALGYVE
jgi:hypothetical protein